MKIAGYVLMFFVTYAVVRMLLEATPPEAFISASVWMIGTMIIGILEEAVRCMTETERQ